MWIRRDVYETMRDELSTLRARAAVLSEQGASSRTQTLFLIARINQLEKERAIMTRALTKLELPIPEIVAVPAAADGQDGRTKQILSALNNSLFEDMGDSAAKDEGLGWDEHGNLIDIRAPHA
jgi:hypothetical protein